MKQLIYGWILGSLIAVPLILLLNLEGVAAFMTGLACGAIMSQVVIALGWGE